MVALLAAAPVAPQVAVLDEKGRGDLVAATELALAPLLHNGTRVFGDGVARRSCRALT